MHRHYLVVLSLISMIFIGGCAGKRINVYPNIEDPVYKEKIEFLDSYINLMIPEERERFVAITSPVELREFEEEFWRIRDLDPATPENEYKDIIDKRVRDIKNEIFAQDLDTPGLRFDQAGGMTGDLARTYLIHGMPGYKEKLVSLGHYYDLTVWYYFGLDNRPIMRFLFYRKQGDKIRLFKKHMPMLDFESLFNSFTSPLREISSNIFITPQELMEMWRELEFMDPQWIFRGALFEFSPYQDIVIENGNLEKGRIGALDPPEPAALAAARVKPTVIGQSEEVSDREFLNNAYHSIIPAKLEISQDDHPTFKLQVAYKDTDWEIKEDNAETIFNIRISFQQKESKALREFETQINILKPKSEVEEKRKGVKAGNTIVPVFMTIVLNDIRNFAESAEMGSTLGHLINNLESGLYVVNVDVRHAVTRKYVRGWREEIVIK